MKPSLQIKLSQQLVLTPQLQQAIKLLQLSTLEMNQEIERYLQDNPLLEREDENERAHEAYNGANGKDRTDDLANGEREASGKDEFPAAERAELSPAEIEEDRWFQDSGGYGNASGANRDRDRDDDEAEAQDLQPAATTLRDYLSWQLNLSCFPTRTNP